MKNKEILKKRIYSFSMAFALTMSLFPQASIPVQAQEVTEEKSEEKGFFEKISDGFSNLFNTSNNNVDTYAAGDVVQTVSPTGTEINVFDYQQFDAPRRRLETAFINEDGTNGNEGINEGHGLKFNATGTGSGKTFNSWTGYIGMQDKQAYTGIVEETLGNDGYPVLNDGLDTGLTERRRPVYTKRESLAYLFDPEMNVQGKQSYSDVQNLLQIDSDNYYSYNSADFFAELNTDENSEHYKYFNVKELGNRNNMGSRMPGYYPFNQLNDSGTDVVGQTKNYHVGTTMTTRFLQTNQGRRADDTDITYEFSGDDDVWIFIDNKLVADLGGIHGAVDVSINFHTGAIKVTRQDTKYLGDIFGVDDGDGNSSTKTLPDNTLHTLKFFYLERGAGDSNMNLRFNLVSVPDSEIIKTDEQGNPIAGARLQLSANDKTVIASGVTDANGSIVLVDDEDRPIYFEDLYNKYGYTEYTLTEISSPKGYRKIKPMHLNYDVKTGAILADENTIWQEGAYASGRFRAYIDSKEQDQDPYAFNEDLNGHTSATDFMREGKLERGMFFALPLRYMGKGGNLANGNDWRGVYSQGNDYFVSKNYGMKGIVEAARNGGATKFSLNTNGQYQVDIEKLPGLLDEYYFYLDQSGKDTNNTKWSTGFYYTTANDFNGVTSDNTIRLANSNDFTRQFAAVFNVPNIKNELYVRKVDEEGNKVNGVIFTLYDAKEQFSDSITAKELRENGTAVGTMETQDLSIPTLEGKDPVVKPGVAKYPSNENESLDNGYYYLVETDVPDGYSLSDSVVQVYVDDTGVYANATANGYDAGQNDGIKVDKGVGYLVDTMSQFAYGVHNDNQYIDTTLHNIIAKIQTSETGQEEMTWTDVDDIHLQYGAEGAVMNYGPEPGENENETPYLEAQDGWSKMVINQCNSHNIDGSYSKNLGDRDITGLFSGYTIVEFTDTRVADLDISKEVRGYENIPESDLTKLQKDTAFTFDISLNLPKESFVDNPIIDKEFEIVYAENKPILDENNDPMTIKNGETKTITLKHNEHAIIKGLPINAEYTIKETGVDSTVESFFEKFKTAIETNNPNESKENATKEDKGFDLFGWLFKKDEKESKTVEDKVNDVKEISGVVKDIDVDTPTLETITVDYFNTYYADGTSIDTNTDFKVKKIFEAWNDENPDAKFTFELRGIDNAPMPEGASEGQTIVSAEVTKTNPIANFGTINYTIPGEYTYIVYEQEPTDKEVGVNYSKERYRIVVDVDDVDGKLVANPRFAKTREDNGNTINPAREVKEISFTNTYTLMKKSVKISGNKTLKLNDSDISTELSQFDPFTFMMKPITDGAPIPEGTPNEDGYYETLSGKDGYFVFGELVFDNHNVNENGYIYEIKEKAGKDEFIICDSTIRYVKLTARLEDVPNSDKKDVKVTQVLCDKDGKPLSNEEQQKGLTFTNEYELKGITPEIKGTKVLQGRQWNKSDKFDFELKATNDNAKTLLNDQALTTLAIVKKDSNISFKLPEIKELKDRIKGDVYTFTLSEVIPEDENKENGMKYDEREVLVTVQVTDNHEGSLVADIQYFLNNQALDKVEFINEYSEQGSYQMTGLKKIEGRTFKSGDTFTFSVTGKDDAPMPSNVDENGQITISPSRKNQTEIDFGTITFSKPGTYEYTVKENDTKIAGIKYDSTEYTVKLTVENTSPGILEVTDTSINSANSEINQLIWTNVYTSSGDLTGETRLGGTKELSGRDWTENDSFTFILEADPNHNPTVEAVNNGKIELPANEITVGFKDVKENKASFKFEDIKFNNVQTPAEKPFRFVIREKDGGATKDGITYDGSKYVVRVSVKDNGNGQLTASVVGVEGDNSFTNEYKALPVDTEIKGTKIVNGHDNLSSTDKFTFTLTALSDDAKVKTPDPIVRQNVDAQQNVVPTISFGTLQFTSADVGKDFRYEITESGSVSGVTNDPTKVFVKIDVTDNGKGQIEAAVTYKENSESGNNKSDVNGFVFTNQALTPATFSMDAKKIVNSNDPDYQYSLKDGEFTFNITPDANNAESDPLQQNTALQTVTNGADGTIKLFNSVQYRDIGEYKYTVKESTNQSGPFDFDLNEHTIIVNVGLKENSVSELEVKGYSVDGQPDGELSFINTYTPTTAVIAGQKNLSENESGKVIGDYVGQFEFTIEPVSGVSLEETPEVPEQPELPQTEEQTPVEQPSEETTPEQPPVIEDAQDEVISEEQTPVELPEEQPDMFNGDILGLIKPIFAEDKLPTGTLEIPAVQNNTAYNDKTGAFSFGKVLFTQPGKFTYRVKETKGNIPGITYDGTSYIVEFTVEEKDGKLIVTNSTYLNETNGTAANGIVFNNSYAVQPTAINISGIKSIEGKDLKEDEFTFLLQDQSGNTIAEAKNNAEGGFVFENIPFDAVGEYNYSVVEKNTGNKGVTYDESKYGVHVEVIDENAQLKATPTITLNGKDVNEITFKNTYKAVQKGTVRIGGQKVLKNRQLVKDEFTFVLKDETGKEISRVTNDEIGAFLFDEIVYDRAGDYTYTVSEIKGSDKTVTYDESVHKVVVSVVDDGLGNLVPEIKYTDDIPVFVNVAEKDSQPPVDPKPEKPADPEKPSGGKDNANTATQTYAGMFVSMMTSAASLAGILAILKKRREI